MSDNNVQTSAEQSDKKISQARSFTYYIFALVAALWLYTLWADRMTPMTDQARVNGQLIRISPEVSGPISQVLITNNSIVKVGDELVTIDPRPFELAVKAPNLICNKQLSLMKRIQQQSVSLKQMKSQLVLRSIMPRRMWSVIAFSPIKER